MNIIKINIMISIDEVCEKIATHIRDWTPWYRRGNPGENSVNVALIDLYERAEEYLEGLDDSNLTVEFAITPLYAEAKLSQELVGGKGDIFLDQTLDSWRDEATQIIEDAV